MREVNPEAILWFEHAGSDWLTQYFDSSWDQTFYLAYPFSEKYYDENMLCYFRFMFPEFKLVTWGESQRHTERNFFNGMGWDMGGSRDQGVARVLATVLRENSDAVSTPQPEPIVSTTDSDLLANRFGVTDKVLYTFYNRSDRTLKGKITEAMPFQGHYVDVLNDVELGADPTIELPSRGVTAVALYPARMEIETLGNEIRVKLNDSANDLSLSIYHGDDIVWREPSRETKIKFTNGIAVWDMSKTSGQKIILKLKNSENLVLDQAVIIKGKK